MAGFIRKVTKRIIVTINVCVTAGMLSLYTIPYVGQDISWFINLLALLFPVLLLLQVGFFIFWLIVKPKLAFIPVVSLLLCWGLIYNTIGLRLPGKLQAKNDTTLRVATWNTHMFNFFESGGRPDEEMIRTVRLMKADVLAVQELVFSLDSSSDFSLENMKKRLGFKYAAAANDRNFGVHTFPATDKERYHPFCVALFSNYPIIKWERVYSLNEYNHTFLMADVKIGNDTVRFVTIHLQSMHFVNKDYDFIENIDDQDPETINKKGRSIIHKMKNAYMQREYQAKFVKNKIDRSPYPVVVCGDMNDVPNSYAYQTISNDLKDAFAEKGSGIGATFKFLSPTLRIDYILHSKALVAKQAKVVRPSPSDHNPVIAEFELKINQ